MFRTGIALIMTGVVVLIGVALTDAAAPWPQAGWLLIIGGIATLAYAAYQSFTDSN